MPKSTKPMFNINVFILLSVLSIVTSVLFSLFKYDVNTSVNQESASNVGVIIAPEQASESPLIIKSLDEQTDSALKNDTKSALIRTFKLLEPSTETGCDSSTPWINGAVDVADNTLNQNCYGISFSLTETADVILLQKVGTSPPLSLLATNCKPLGFTVSVFNKDTEVRMPKTVDGQPSILRAEQGGEKTQYTLVSLKSVPDQNSSAAGAFNSLVSSVNNICGQAMSMNEDDINLLIDTLRHQPDSSVASVFIQK